MTRLIDDPIRKTFPRSSGLSDLDKVGLVFRTNQLKRSIDSSRQRLSHLDVANSLPLDDSELFQLPTAYAFVSKSLDQIESSTPLFSMIPTVLVDELAFQDLWQTFGLEIESNVAPLEEDLVNWEAEFPNPPAKKSRKLRVKLKYVGRGVPIPTDDDRWD